MKKKPKKKKSKSDLLIEGTFNWIASRSQKTFNKAKLAEIRRALKVPEGIRIAQHIYNKFRDYEEFIEIYVKYGNHGKEQSARGIDIYYVEDAEFIKRFK